jgi:hypothetical protein
MRYQVGSRVNYRVYPSGMPDTGAVGTVVGIDRHQTKRARLVYAVQWDDVDYSDRTNFVPARYMSSDLARVACDDCGADTGEVCRPYCTGAAAATDTASGVL